MALATYILRTQNHQITYQCPDERAESPWPARPPNTMQAQLRPAPLLGQRQHALRSSQGPGHCPGQPRRLRLAAPRAQQLQEPPPAPSKARLNDRRSVTGQPARCTHGRNSAPAPPAAAALASSATLASLASHPPCSHPRRPTAPMAPSLPSCPSCRSRRWTLRHSAPPPRRRRPALLPPRRVAPRAKRAAAGP